MKDKFKAVYLKHLAQCVIDFPNDYAWMGHGGLTVPIVAERMFNALDKGTANIDSHSFKRTCKELGIKHTQKAIKEFWNK